MSKEQYIVVSDRPIWVRKEPSISSKTIGLIYPNEMIVVDIKYPIAGVLFIVAALTDMIDGKLARKNNQVTDLGKMLDAIADKVLVNTILVALSASGFVHPIIPIVVIFRDEVVNSIKMVSGNKGKVVAASKMGKIKTACMMTGIALTLFYNLPFELWNLKVADMLLVIKNLNIMKQKMK